MSSFEERSGGFADRVSLETETDRVVVIAESDSVSTERRSRFALLPLLLGSLFLLVNVFVFVGQPGVFSPDNVHGAISLVLIIASVAICLVLVAYGTFSRRYGDASSDARSRFLQAIVVPLVLGLLAPLLTVWALQTYRSSIMNYDASFNRPCLDVYQRAADAARDNPRFRLPSNDADEVRCGVNAALGR